MEFEKTKIGRYEVRYQNRKELNILKEEIFQNEIYSVNIAKDRKKELRIVDVGAHIGLATLYFKSLYPNSHITCFEPNPTLFTLLNENIFHNGLENVRTHNMAIAKNTGLKEFHIDSSEEQAFSTGSFRKNAWNGKQKSKPITVKTKPLSNFVKEKTDLVKLDVEGVEYEVLKELQNSGCLENIENMIIEYHPIKGQNVNNIISLLQESGFNLKFSQDGEPLDYPKEDLILIVAKKGVKSS